MPAPSDRLLEFVVRLATSPLPDQLTQCATLALIDTVGCGLYGASQPWGRIINEQVVAEGSRGGATLYGAAHVVAPRNAALANGTSSHGFELDDVMLGALVHPGAVVVSAALAAAEHAKVSGPRLLGAIVAGYEVTDRVSWALGAEHNTRGFHTTGIAGAVAATVTAGIIFGMDTARVQSAIGIACSSASGIKAFTQGTGGMVKRMHAGRAAESGLLACELAQRGFTGPTQGIDGRYGLLEVFGGPDRDAELLDKDLGDSPAITRIWVKAYPCCGLLHTTANALELIKRENRPEPREVKQIRVRTGRRAVEQNGDPYPRETMNAQYSIPFCAGVSLAKNARDPNAYALENLDDPDVRGLAAKTALVVDETMDRHFPSHFAARVEVETTGGRIFEKTLIDAHGMPADPCTPSEIEAKFRLLAGAAKTEQAVERLIGAARRLPTADTLETWSQALRAGSILNTQGAAS